MIYVDDLNKFLKIVKKKPVAQMGFNKKHPTLKPFHSGHLYMVDKLKTMDATFKVAVMSDDRDISNYIFGTKKNTNEPFDLKYMKNTLSDFGVDIFYYLNMKDFQNNWCSRVDVAEIKNKIEDIIKKEGYLNKYRTWYFLSYLSDKFYNRKYWLGSSKDGYVRVAMKDYCSKYTNINVVTINRIKNTKGNIYSSSEGIV
jgi:nicotinamide mononucleotide adenylyltransferase